MSYCPRCRKDQPAIVASSHPAQREQTTCWYACSVCRTPVDPPRQFVVDGERDPKP